MKKYAILFLLTLLLFSCIPIENNDELNNDFYLTDSTGFETSIFSSGDSFYMQFYYINTTSDTIDYTVSDSRPAVIFYIDDDAGERIASSVDGFGFYQVIMNYQLAPGDTLKGSWLAPATPAQDPQISLDAGQYTASVEFQGTPELDIPCTMEMIFNVNE